MEHLLSKACAQAEKDELTNMWQKRSRDFPWQLVSKDSQWNQICSVLRQAWLLCAIQHAFKLVSWVSVTKAKVDGVVTKRNSVAHSDTLCPRLSCLNKTLFSFPPFVDTCVSPSPFFNFLFESNCELKNWFSLFCTHQENWVATLHLNPTLDLQ